MSDTPETDAFFEEWTFTSGVLAKSRLHAEKLERERDETMEALEKCREDSICYAEYMRRCGYSAAYEESQENADRATIILNKLKEEAK